MNKKLVKITAIVIAVVFVLGLLGPLAYTYVFSAPVTEKGADEKTLDELTIELEEAEKRLMAAEELEKEILQDSGERFRIMSERGNLSYLDIIFSANSFADFIDRVVIAREIAEYDKNMIAAIKSIKSDSAATREEVEGLIRAIEVEKMETSGRQGGRVINL